MQMCSLSSLAVLFVYEPMRRDRRKLSDSDGKPTRSTSASCRVEAPMEELSKLLVLSKSPDEGGPLPFVIARRISSVTALPALPTKTKQKKLKLL